MAPRFENLMYQVYPSGKGADAIVCFPFAKFEAIFLFRDRLTETILKKTDHYVTSIHCTNLKNLLS